MVEAGCAVDGRLSTVDDDGDGDDDGGWQYGLIPSADHAGL